MKSCLAARPGSEAAKRSFLNLRQASGLSIPGATASSIMKPSYQLFTSEVEYRQACDMVVGRAGRELLIFDRDLRKLQLEDNIRLQLLTSFLASDRLRRIRIALHDPEPLHRQAPRLMQVIARFSHMIEVRQSPGNLRHLADSHLLADDAHGVRRFHIDQPRSALVIDDPAYIHPWWQRFEELWDLSHPCLQINTTGL
jgi:hypothetical protein